MHARAALAKAKGVDTVTTIVPKHEDVAVLSKVLIGGDLGGVE